MIDFFFPPGFYTSIEVALGVDRPRRSDVHGFLLIHFGRTCALFFFSQVLMCHFMFLSFVEGPRWALMGLAVKLAQSVSRP